MLGHHHCLLSACGASFWDQARALVQQGRESQTDGFASASEKDMCAPGAGPTYNLGSEKETMTLWDHHIATAAWLELIAPSWVAVIDLADSSSLMTAELSQHLYNFIPGTSGCSSNSFSSSCGIKESK